MTQSKTNLATAPLRPQEPGDRRQEERWKRLTIWLTPEEADTLQTLGDQWLGRRVKALLADAAGHKQRHPTLHAVTAGDPIPDAAAGLIEGRVSGAELAERGRTIALLFRIGLTTRDIAALLHLAPSEVARVLAPAPESFILRGEPTTQDDPQDQADLMQEVDSLLAQGLSGTDIARQFNAAGRRTTSGTDYCAPNLIRDWRRWKGTAI